MFPAPVFANSQSVNFYRFGSRARIAVACNPALVSLFNGSITQQVSWDYVAQQLTPYAPAYNPVAITGAIWASTGGGQTTYTVGTDLTAVLSAGDFIEVSGIVNSGGTSTTAFNGNWKVLSVTSTTVVVSAPSAATLGTYVSGGSIAAGGGALNVKVLAVQSSNCKTVNYNAATNSATWNNNGACALILL